MIVALLFIIALVFFGLVLAKKFFEDNLLVYAFPLGILFATWLVFLLSFPLGFTQASILFSAIILFGAAFQLKKLWRIELKQSDLLSKQLLALFVAAFVFFAAMNYLMFHYDAEGNLAGIRTDFGFHHAIISSLANGNFPPEHPLFAGHALIYYYFTHLFSASLMLGGFNLQAASYTPSVLLNTSIVCLIFLLVKRLFSKEFKEFKEKRGKEKKKQLFYSRIWSHLKTNSLAYLAIALVLFNGSFAFIPWAEQNKLGLNNIAQIWPNPKFYYGAYYEAGYAFQTLLVSILLLQRIFLIGICLFLIILLLLLEKNRNNFLFIGLLLGLLPMFHLFSFILIILFLAVYAVFFDRTKNWLKTFFVAGGLALPQLVFFLQQKSALNFIQLRLGWMSPGQDLFSITWFWAANLGIYLILAAIAFYLIKDKKIRALYLSTFPAFVLANLFIFTPYNWDNFKFFVFFFILTAILAAYALKQVWSIQFIGKSVTIVLFVLMALTGFLSLWTIAAHSNDVIYPKEDIQACDWVEKNIPKKALFLTDGGHTCLFATAGRKIFLGYAEWLKNHGYDYSKQLEENNKMLQGNCELMKKREIQYIFIGGFLGRSTLVNESLLVSQRVSLYKNKASIWKIVC